MFELAELGHTIDKATFDKEEPKLRAALLDAQYDVLKAATFPVIVVIAGVDGAGKGETVNVLNEWMDPRHVHTHAFGAPSDEERERPHMWRFWRALPPKGTLGIFFGSWYTAPILDRVYGRMKDVALDNRLNEIVAFEKMLTDEGALLLKFWFHLSKKKQKARLKELEAHKNTRWRVTKNDWEHFELYDEFRRVSERTLRETSRHEALWTVVEGTDKRYRELTVGKTILEAMHAKLAAIEARKKETKGTPGKGRKGAATTAAVDAPLVPRHDTHICVVRSIDLSKKLANDEYADQLDKYQRKLNLLTRKPGYRKIATVAVFEGSDAAGKGGTIRRVTGALDARQYRVIPIAAPTDEERAQPYLWRFWRMLPRLQQLTIFDRSWYGRVLVEQAWGGARGEGRTPMVSPPADFESAASAISPPGLSRLRFYHTVPFPERMC